MTFREKIADWISGGEFKRRSKAAEEWYADYCWALNKSTERKMMLNHRDKFLREIIAMETEHANATVKRMAAHAKEALGERGPL